MVKKQGVISLVAGCVMALAAPAILADSVPAKPIDMTTIISNLNDQGYVVIREIKFDDNAYKAEAFNKQGQKVDVKMNADTGKIESPQAPQTQPISLTDAVKKANSAGFTTIYAIEAKDNSYEMKALDKNGKKNKVTVDLAGNVTNKMSD